MSGSVTRDLWSAIQPNIETPALKRIVSIGNKTLPSEDSLYGILYVARAYMKEPPPARFRFIASPLVMWIWIGGLIVFGGGLIALWPLPAYVRRRVRSASGTP